MNDTVEKSGYRQLLEAVGTALSVIGSVTSIPGIDLIPYVGVVSKAVGYAQAALSIGGKIAPYAEALVETFSGGLPTPEQLAALDAKLDDMHAKIQGFNPVAEPGEES